MKKSIIKKICILSIVLLFLVSCAENKQKETFSSYKDLNNKNIAVWSGSIYEDAILDKIENPNIQYMNVLSDMIQAMYNGKIDAVANSKTAFLQLKEQFPNIVCIDDLGYQFEIGAIFPKSEKGNNLKAQYNKFLKEIEESGQKEFLQQEWIFNSAHNYEGLNKWDCSNGKLKVQCGFSTPPYVYVCNNEFAGYEIALVAEFAKANHYEVEFENNDFSALISSLHAGMCDMCISGIEHTKERAEEVDFSDPEYIDSVVFFVQDNNNFTKEYNGLDELHGLKGGFVDGTIAYQLMDDCYSDCEKFSFISTSDAYTALKNRKIDFILDDISIAKLVLNNIQGLSYIDEKIYTEDIAFYTGKNSDRQQTILNQLNEYISNNESKINEISTNWLNNVDTKPLDIVLDESNDTIVFACNGATQPYCFVKDNEIVGMEVDIIKSFAKEYGYNVRIDAYETNGLIQAAVSEKADICGGCLSITKERTESVNYSLPFSHDYIVAIVRTTKANENIFDSLLLSFEKNFIREDRYKLILSGIYSTLKISLLSTIFGTIFGFLLYMITKKANEKIITILKFISNTVDGLPMIVILMILYYVIFSKSLLDGETISIFGFSFTFLLAVYNMIYTAVKSVDIGQYEAAYSLGFSDTKTFFEIVLPQALTQFLPGYKSAIVNLVKGTAVVGYIAVQDLTKASDMIRSRTYEAFFPLIVTAIIYLLLGKLLTLLIKRIEITIKPNKLSKQDIIKKFEK